MKIHRLGIIGAENSHSVEIGKICNLLKKIPMRVTHLWGETDEEAKSTAEQAEIPTIVKDWREMAGEVDGIMIDHRHGKLHSEPAEFFIAKGLPTFVDKPIACDLAEAKRLLRLGDEFNTPVITFSALPIQQSFIQFTHTVKENGRLVALNTTGPGDVDSQWGGVFFYGIHQVDSVVELMGTDAKVATIMRSGKNAVATINYEDGRFATMNIINEGAPKFHWFAQTEMAAFSLAYTPDDLPYLSSATLIHGLLAERKVPYSHARILAPIAILEALVRSLDSGRPEAIYPL